MNKLNKALVLFVFAVIAILNSALIYADELGCCTNPNAGAFLCLMGSNVFKNAECCPTPESSYPDYYSGSTREGPADYNDCASGFFHIGKNCNEVEDCKLGCCCGPSTAAIKTENACSGTGFTFYDGTTDCSSVCAVPECSDGVDNDNNGCEDYPIDSGCQGFDDATESGGECNYDCGSVSYEPKLKNLVISPVKGENKIKLKWGDECYKNSIYYEIYRCKGISCKDLTLLGTSLNGVREFTDDSEELLFNQDYTYQVKAYYSLQSATPAIEGKGNLGDMECWHKADNAEFCIHSSYYNSYKNYLIANLGFTAASFDKDVKGQFGHKFNTPYSCDSANKLTAGSKCSDNTICVMIGAQASCLEEPKCNYPAAANPFGLYYQQTSCEKDKYCFYDRSFTVVNNCFACNPEMSCYDYKSKESCGRDNCGTGNCEWRDLSTEFGTGVCVNKIEENCNWCDKAGTQGVESNKATSKVFEVCTREKAQKLSVDGNKCFYKDGKAKSCRDLTCTDYDGEDCSTAQIKLDSSNRIVNPKSDACGIGVCQMFGNGCRKNADGDNKADCNGEECEKDYFKPDTIITPVIENGIYKRLDIHISDKTISSGAATSKTGSGYSTYICNGCTGSHPFSKAANSSRLIIANLKLLDSRTGEVLATLSEGKNILRYYSVDPSKNAGLVKTIEVMAHSNTAGPIVQSVEVSSANKFGDIFYTNEMQPKVLVNFYEAASITRAKLINDYNNQAITPTYDTNLLKEVILYLPGSLANGNYTLEFEAKNQKGIYIDKPSITRIIIDDKKPSLVISPAEGELVVEEEVPVDLIFDEEVNILDVMISGEDFTEEFISGSQGNSIFNANLKLNDGDKQVNVRAADYAGNEIYATSVFIVNARPLNITLKWPSYGVASSYVFDVIVVTDNKADCRYNFNDPLEYDFMISFDSTGGFEHKVNDFNQIPDGSAAEHSLYVKCNDPVQGLGAKTFKLIVDTTPPVIETGYAYPNPVVETPPLTKLKIQTDELTMCRYSQTQTDYEWMEYNFLSEVESFRTVHEQNISLPGEGTHAYYIGCRNLAELASETIKVTAEVDFNISLIITDHTPKYFPVSQTYLALETNRKAQCKYSTSSAFDSSGLFGPSGHTHVKELELSSGQYTYYVQCKDIVGWSDVVQVQFAIDDSPPEMKYVNDASTLLSHPEFSCYMNRLRVKWLGEDSESGVKKYTYSLLDASGGAIFSNRDSYWYSDPGAGDEWYWVNNLDLQNNTKYHFEVTAANHIYLVSEPGTSDGVEVDTALCKSCSNSKDDCCFIEEGDDVCDPDCDEPDGVPVDTDCDDCTSAEGDCCDVSNGNGCDQDCPPGADPDCGYVSCTSDNECDTSNNRWCNSGWWSDSSYCDSSICGMEDYDCGIICTDNSCDKENRKWCEGSTWKSGTYSQYCSRCSYEDSSCPVCENNVCDTGNKKWCDSGKWSVVDYCSRCGEDDASCNEDCDSGTCDQTNKKWCDNGIWNENNYCENCGKKDSSCVFECSNDVCDIDNKFWCDNGVWNNSDYCSKCGSEDYSCAASCTNGECDEKANRWCDGNSWTQLGYCDHCDDSDCTGTCLTNACDIIADKWCSSGEWVSEDYCSKCGREDYSCFNACEDGVCDIDANRRCSDGTWLSTTTYCDSCVLKDSDCTIACAEGECDTSYKKTCKGGRWTDESYCDYCTDYDSTCLADCSVVKDDCCTGIAEGTCDPDCAESSDTDCDDCTASQGDCCYPSNDAICDLDCPSGMDPDCASNACQNMGDCEIGQPCTDQSQCSSLFCSNNKCEQATCSDDMKNGKESDKDCGGSCVKCEDDKSCNEGSDCESNYCAYGACNSDTCFDNQLSGSETDVDCGGACPTKCSEGSYCNYDDDCISGAECYLEKCTVCSAGNGYCGTDEVSVDSDGDGMPDEWELQHGFDPNDPTDASGDADGGLVNLDEYTYRTDPNKEDTDGDGYSDKKEIDAGTDPLDPDDKPKSKIWVILLMLLGGVLVGGIGFFAYHTITAKSKEQVRPMGRPVPKFERRPAMPATPSMPRAPVKKGVPAEQTSRIKEMRKKRGEERAKKIGNAFEAFGDKKAVEGKEKATLNEGTMPAASVKHIKKEKGKPRKKSKQDVFARLSREVTEAKNKEGKPTKKGESRVTKKLKKIAKRKK